MRCGVEVAALRRDPTDDAEQVTQALLGEELRVEEEAGGWARVVTAYGYPGWIRVGALADGDGDPLVTRFDSPLDAARSFLGAPYLWGGMTRAGIDCSGLVHMAYRLCGRLVVRDAWQQEAAGEPVEEPQPGDLATYGADCADHVAFWLGEGRILHATGRDGLGVVEEDEPHQLSARRRTFMRL